MLFNSLAFAVFLPITFTIYWILPNKYRWILLLVSSYYFYMSWNIKYVFLILFTTIVSYFAAIVIEECASKSKRKVIMALASVLCLGVLFAFKYFNFVSQAVADIINVFSIDLSPFLINVILPVGISFYTFQTLSYVIDVYRGDILAEHHFGYYATFVSFFPQLVAGPIERTINLLPQIKSEHLFDYNNGVSGLKLIAWGFFKKMVIADGLSRYVDLVFGDVSQFVGLPQLCAVIFFSIQVYCDFSGYSDIARGVGKLLDIELMENFQSPYLASSFKEFWQRWHISLSTWFKDYVYIPLGGNRKGNVRTYINLIITFTISGLWHGANWTFVLWGILHGVLQVIEKLLKLDALKSRFVLFIRRIIVDILVALLWVFFRAQSLKDAIFIISNMFNGIADLRKYILYGFNDIGFTKGHLVFYILCIFTLFVYDYAKYLNKRYLRNKYITFALYMILIIVTIIQCGKGMPAEFVYFQF